jgi:hypothetical protein
MNIVKRIILVGVMGIAGLSAYAERIRVPAGTDVELAFAQKVSSKTIKAGDTIRLTVAKNVRVGGRTILRKGQSVTGVVSKVDKRKRFGINAQLRIALNPIRTHGSAIKLEPRQKGDAVGGSRGTQAGAVAAGGAVVLGPIGLLGGYFVVGKEVNIKVGDKLQTQVSESTTLRF